MTTTYGTTTGSAAGVGARVALTLLGAAGLIVGAFMEWIASIDGTKLAMKALWTTNFHTTETFVATVGFASIVVGLVAIVGLAIGSGWLTRLAGGRLSRQVILSGRKLWAHEPQAALVCDEVVDPHLMDEAVRVAAQRLASPAVVANRDMINIAEEPVETFRAYAAEFALEQAIRLYSDDVISKVGRFSAGTTRAPKTRTGR